MHQGYFMEQEMSIYKHHHTALNGDIKGEGKLEQKVEGMSEDFEMEDDIRTKQAGEKQVEEYISKMEIDDDEEKETARSELRQKLVLQPERRRFICDTLKQVMLSHLKTAIAEYVRHECGGCRVDHPSQKHHRLCLWVKPKEWIEEYGIHEHVLNCLNVYDILVEWDELLWKERAEANHRRREYGDIKGIAELTSRETVEVYKNWEFLKDSHYSYIRGENNHWKDFWKKALLEEYKDN